MIERCVLFEYFLSTEFADGLVYPELQAPERQTCTLRV